jgi:uncharacterized ferritin-like protein (DUF455 family)
MNSRELRAAALDALTIADPGDRCAAVDAMATITECDPRSLPVAVGSFPARPARPRLVPAKQVPKRGLQSPQGRAALLHSLAHIEFNAIALALDAIWRFGGMPCEYYFDWCGVALDETRHFRLLSQHLATLGHVYGDFDAHDALWEMAARSADDVLERMATVPRTLEARALDASPRVRAGLAAAGDERAAQVLDIILNDEIRHVAIGNRWFNWLCRERGRDPLVVQDEITRRHRLAPPRGPINVAARRAAGFSENEIRILQNLMADRRMMPD